MESARVIAGLLRMVRDAMWALREPEVDRAWLTTCIAVAKAVQG